MQHKTTSSVIFKSLVSLAIAPVFVSAVLSATRYDKTLAQSPAPSQTFPLPSALPNGTTVRLDGSSSMTVTNNDLKKRFEEKFPGSVISLSGNGTDAALQALQKGEIDLAAIGRLLTDEEKAQGLMEAPLSRQKIAIIVSSANPFKGSITDDQFVKIFRGEIKNWSELGGPNVPIRFIDRPASSDTRQALSRYPGFNSGLQTGANATQVAQDDTSAVIKELGADGISYAIVDQVVNQPDVVALPMHDIPPTDSRYPYSQPRNYVYRRQPNPGVVAFLGFATATLGQDTLPPPANPPGAAVVPASPAAPASGAVAPTANPAPTAAPAEQEGGFDLSFLWWLLIPLVGIPLLFWLLKGRGAAPPGSIAATQSGRMILVARNCRDAYAYWEVPPETFEEARRQGGRDLKVRLHDITDVPGLDGQTPHKVQEFSCSENVQDFHIPVDVDDRTYAAELGYVTDTGEWLRIAHSDPVHVPACIPDSAGVSTAAAAAAGGMITGGAARSDTQPGTPGTEEATRSVTNRLDDVPATTSDAIKAAGATLAGGAAAVAGASADAAALFDRSQATGRGETAQPALDYRITLEPRGAGQAYVSWEVAEAYKQALRDRGGRQLTLQIHDATNIDIDYHRPHSTQTYACDETDQEKYVAIPVADRDYVADLGYFTDDNRWLRLARSMHVHVPANS
ncbi:DUF4912 domain-containing protein [Leptodesmis sp.]|uniref:DUF4912 domain-containing protein n=1 Tax=Leptodesmis sp. TaxID=3100501 RepID=UPI0040535356